MYLKYAITKTTIALFAITVDNNFQVTQNTMLENSSDNFLFLNTTWNFVILYIISSH